MDYMLGNEECSSGCESGWTLYLQHSSISADACYDREHDSRGNRVFTKRSNEEEEEEEDEDEEDEDLSMVSDASSGPPHLHEEEGYGGGNEKNGCSFYPYAIDEPSSSRNNIINLTKKKNRENRCSTKLQQHSSLLDDTASSPFLDFCNKTRSQTSVENVVEYSQGYSTTQFELRPPYQEEHYDFFQSGNQLQQQNQWFEGKRW